MSLSGAVVTKFAVPNYEDTHLSMVLISGPKAAPVTYDFNVDKKLPYKQVLKKCFSIVHKDVMDSYHDMEIALGAQQDFAAPGQYRNDCQQTCIDSGVKFSLRLTGKLRGQNVNEEVVDLMRLVDILQGSNIDVLAVEDKFYHVCLYSRKKDGFISFSVEEVNNHYPARSSWHPRCTIL